MKKRLTIYCIITFIALLLFTFVPGLNIGGSKAVSIYQEIRSSNALLPILLRLAALCGVFFISLLFLFGLGQKKEGDEN